MKNGMAGSRQLRLALKHIEYNLLFHQIIFSVNHTLKLATSDEENNLSSSVSSFTQDDAVGIGRDIESKK
jgi:hypothetical protein